jgi:recombination protein U
MTHANLGKAFEAAVEAINLEYRMEGLADIEKSHPEWVIVRRGREIVSAFPRSKGGVDFYGEFWAGGRVHRIYFDAKETRFKTRFPFANIKDGQIDFLKRKAAFGAVVFLLVHFEPVGRCFLVDWEAVERAMAAGRASLSFAECTSGVEVPWRGQSPDYLEPILSMINQSTEAS